MLQTIVCWTNEESYWLSLAFLIFFYEFDQSLLCPRMYTPLQHAQTSYSKCQCCYVYIEFDRSTQKSTPNIGHKLSQRIPDVHVGKGSLTWCWKEYTIVGCQRGNIWKWVIVILVMFSKCHCRNDNYVPMILFGNGAVCPVVWWLQQ